MRVQYTIPGWAPAVPARSSEAASAFETRLRESSGAIPVSSREILGLNRTGAAELVLGPPPRPATLAYSDLDQERRMWHGMLRRHEGSAEPAERRMLALLAELQQLEEAVTARALVDSRG